MLQSFHLGSYLLEVVIVVSKQTMMVLAPY